MTGVIIVVLLLAVMRLVYLCGFSEAMVENARADLNAHKTAPFNASQPDHWQGWNRAFAELLKQRDLMTLPVEYRAMARWAATRTATSSEQG